MSSDEIDFLEVLEEKVITKLESEKRFFRIEEITPRFKTKGHMKYLKDLLSRLVREKRIKKKKVKGVMQYASLDTYRKLISIGKIDTLFDEDSS